MEELHTSLRVAGWNDWYDRRKRNPTLKAALRNSVKQIYLN